MFTPEKCLPLKVLVDTDMKVLVDTDMVYTDMVDTEVNVLQG